MEIKMIHIDDKLVTVNVRLSNSSSIEHIIHTFQIYNGNNIILIGRN